MKPSNDFSILIVDDEPGALESLAYHYEDSYKVFTSQNAAEALALMKRKTFSTAIVDIILPDLRGEALLEAFKKQWPITEVIMITGYPAVESAKKAVSLGAYDYLAKPVGPDEVINAANGAMLHKKWALRRDQQGQCAGVR